jgi:hypothetical protein
MDLKGEGKKLAGGIQTSKKAKRGRYELLRRREKRRRRRRSRLSIGIASRVGLFFLFLHFLTNINIMKVFDVFSGTALCIGFF